MKFFKIITPIFLIFTLQSHTFQDLSGRKVEIPSIPKRIICTGPGALRLIVYLGLSSRIVGVEEIEKKYPYGRPYIITNPGFAKLPSFAKGGPPGENPLNEEEIIALHPHVIFATYIEQKTADLLQRKLKIPVVILSYGKLATFNNKTLFKSLLLIGKITGKEQRAKEIISYITSIERDLLKRTRRVGRKPPVYIGGLGYKGSHGIDSTMGKFPPFTLVDVRNLTDQLKIQGWVHIDREKLLEWNPEYIFIDEGGLKLVMEDFKKNPSFYFSLKAVKNGKVYGLLPYNFYATNIEIALANSYFIGKIVHPEKFRDIKPERKADDIFKFFVGQKVYKNLQKHYGGYFRIKFK